MTQIVVGVDDRWTMNGQIQMIIDF